MLKLKKYIPETMKIQIKLLFATDKDPKWMKYSTSDKRNIFIFLAGFYQNMGDLAITYAQNVFLEAVFPQSNIVLIPSNETYFSVKTIKSFIRPGDIITLIGGGNLDDIYISLENARLFVVKNFPNNKIISFPQTFAFSDTEYGKKRLAISQRVYAYHRNLTIFVREPYSLERIKAALPDVQIGYCPDIVLSLNKFYPQYERHGVLCCLRSDKEQDIKTTRREALIKKVNEEFSDVMLRDTVDVALEDCQPETYELTLEDFWDMLRHKEVVITDRLHCMIFCAITGTPCVVLDNSNHKVSGVYRAWLKDVGYIRFSENSDPETVIGMAKKLSKTSIDKVIDLSSQFDPLRRALQE